MLRTIYLGKLSGIRVYIHWSFWLIAIFVFLSELNAFEFEVRRAIAAVGFLFAIFLCVFLHEMGHALSARFFGVKTLDITLLPFGGLARLEHMPRTPIAELTIAIAGPAVNIVIALSLLIGLSISAAFDRFNSGGLGGMGPLEQLLIANIFLAVFNLIPAFPMDGGRVLRSVLAMFLPYLRATEIAARIGQFLAVVMIVGGLFYGLSLAMVGVFVLISSTTELFRERLQAAQRNGSSQPGAGTFTFTFGDGTPMQPPYESPPHGSSHTEIIDAVDVKRID